MTKDYFYKALSSKEQFMCKLANFLSNETSENDDWAACEEILFTAANHLDLEHLLLRDETNTTLVEYWSDRCAVIDDEQEAAKYLYEETCKFPKDQTSPLDEALKDLENDFNKYNAA